MTDPKVINFVNYNLRQVVFTTTSVDDGYELDTVSCTSSSGVSPKSQTNSATDNSIFECTYSCSYDGTTLQILYE